MADFSEQIINAVWQKGQIVQGVPPHEWRKDIAGAWMHRNYYGEQTTYGWSIDHIAPVSKGGGDALYNLQPLQWENNITKGDSYPSFDTSVSSNGRTNLPMKRSHRA